MPKSYFEIIKLNKSGGGYWIVRNQVTSHAVSQKFDSMEAARDWLDHHRDQAVKETSYVDVEFNTIDNHINNHPDMR